MKSINLSMMRLPLKIFFLLLIAFSCSPLLYSQKYSFKNYTVANGLGSSTLNHIFQDSKGYIWLATQGGGLSRFNGKEFKNFTKTNGLINNDVTYITEDRHGNIWIATAAGASKFDGLIFKNYGQKEGLTDGIVFCIYADTSGRIFFALKEGGIKILDGTKFNSFTTENGLPSNEAYSIAQDKTGNYWFGVAGGIVKYRKGEITSYSNSEIINNKNFFCSYIDKKGTAWFGSIGGGVVTITTDNIVKSFKLPPNVSNDFIGSITEDKNGNLWFATDHGLLKYNGNGFKLFSEREGLSVNAVQTVMSDYEGNIWAGTAAGGVDVLSSEAFVRYTDKDGLATQNINCIFPAPDGKTYYLGTGEGLYIFNPQAEPKFRKINQPKEIERVNVSSISVDKNGLLWLCAQEGVFAVENNKGIFRLKKHYSKISGERVITPHQVIHDSKGNIWVATFGSGVFFLNSTTEKNYSTQNGFASNDILAIYEDSRTNIWFGTQNAGVIKYDARLNDKIGQGKSFENISQKYHLPDKAIWSITESENGTMFFGTGESGLYYFDARLNDEVGQGKRTETYSTKNGLSSDYITSLRWDKFENCLRVGSENGLDKIKFADDNRIEKIHTYKEQDGFNATGINPNSIWIDHSGFVWLGTANGLWTLNPKNDYEQNVPPKIQLTEVRIAYQKVDWKNFADSVDSPTNLPVNLELAYHQNHLTFDIQALTTEEVLYTFKLDGQDEDWSAPAKNNQITYTNIEPGKEYTFKAKAVSSTGIVSAETKPFSFTIRPPWWNTWWFRLALFTAVISSIFAFIKAREKTLREQNRKLEETVKQRTKEIEHQKEIVEQTLEEKEGLLHEKEILLKEIHHRVKNNLQTISSMLMLQSAGLKDEQAKKAIAESQSRVRSIALVHQKLYQNDGLEKVELNAFIKDLTEQVKSVYRDQSKSVSIRWDIPETHLLIDKAIPLGLIFNELLTNSFKYAFNESQRGEIKIKLDYITQENSTTDKPFKTKKVMLSYWDSGPGLKSDLKIENAQTLGLRLIKLLSQQIGAILTVNGSEFIFTFTLNI